MDTLRELWEQLGTGIMLAVSVLAGALLLHLVGPAGWAERFLVGVSVVLAVANVLGPLAIIAFVGLTSDPDDAF